MGILSFLFKRRSPKTNIVASPRETAPVAPRKVVQSPRIVSRPTPIFDPNVPQSGRAVFHSTQSPPLYDLLSHNIESFGTTTGRFRSNQLHEVAGPRCDPMDRFHEAPCPDTVAFIGEAIVEESLSRISERYTVQPSEPVQEQAVTPPVCETAPEPVDVTCDLAICESDPDPEPENTAYESFDASSGSDSPSNTFSD
jgi:hypothetical protein